MTKSINKFFPLVSWDNYNKSTKVFCSFKFIIFFFCLTSCISPKKNCKFLIKRKGVSTFLLKRTIYKNSIEDATQYVNGIYYQDKKKYIIDMDSNFMLTDKNGTILIDELSHYNVFISQKKYRYKSLTLFPIDISLLTKKYAKKGVYTDIYKNENIDTLFVIDSQIVIKNKLRTNQINPQINGAIIDSIFFLNYSRKIDGYKKWKHLSVQKLIDSTGFTYQKW